MRRLLKRFLIEELGLASAVDHWWATQQSVLPADRPPNVHLLWMHLVGEHAYRGSYKSVRKYVRYGGSPRGVQAVILAAKIRALLENRFAEGIPINLPNAHIGGKSYHLPRFQPVCRYRAEQNPGPRGTGFAMGMPCFTSYPFRRSDKER